MPKILIKPFRSRIRTEGFHVLASCLWPKGLSKAAVDCWAKDLGPDPELLDHRACGLSPQAYILIYRNALRRPCIQNRIKPLSLLSLRRRIVLLCTCPNQDFCHDRFLAQAIETGRMSGDFTLTRCECASTASDPKIPACMH